MSGVLVADLGIGPVIWLFLALLTTLTLFFKFNRIWSVRNLDLLLLFVFAPGMMLLVGSGPKQPWLAFVFLFIASTLWLARCLLDLGLTRRPLLEPNLDPHGLACLAAGVLGLLLAETSHLPIPEGVNRNPADPHAKPSGRGAAGDRGDSDAKIREVIASSPLPVSFKRTLSKVILSRVLAALAQIGLVAGLLVVGSRHFERPIAGLSVAVCYLISPYTRIAVVDGGQLIPAALVVWAIAAYGRPWTSGALIGLASGWMPACLGLVPLWAGFYKGRGAWRFAIAALAIVLACGSLAMAFPPLADWCRDLGARSLAEAGLWPTIVAPETGSFWSRIDPIYRVPVLIPYLALVVLCAFWPAEKNLGELISLSAALLIASQFWYLDEGGTLILLYLPLLLLMMFRPNLATKRPPPLAPRRKSEKKVAAASP